MRVENTVLIMLRKAMDMKAAMTVQRSNRPLRAKPGEKKFLFLFLFFFLKDSVMFSAVRVASGKMKMTKLSTISSP